MYKYQTTQDTIYAGIEETFDQVMNQLYNRYHVHLSNSTRIPLALEHKNDFTFYEVISPNHYLNSGGKGLTPIGKLVY